MRHETRPARGIAILALSCALAACQPGGNPLAGLMARARGGDAAPAVPGRAPANVLLESDVEAPAVFAADEEALWDGRPSLGGIWVASPDATTPERVVMRVPDTDREVVGALFRREREAPGPRLQLSSEAAAALGILAGAPTRIAVVALRDPAAEAEAPAAAGPAPATP